MSLDVYLIVPELQEGGSGIFVRENGSNREISRAEWDEKFPGRDPVVIQREGSDNTVFSQNITHNLGKMADSAHIYEALWRPEEIGITHARQLIEPLTTGLEFMRKEADYLEQFNPENGWGNYDNLMEFVTQYLEACEKWPDAEVSVWR